MPSTFAARGLTFSGPLATAPRIACRQACVGPGPPHIARMPRANEYRVLASIAYNTRPASAAAAQLPATSRNFFWVETFG